MKKLLKITVVMLCGMLMLSLVCQAQQPSNDKSDNRENLTKFYNTLKELQGKNEHQEALVIEGMTKEQIVAEIIAHALPYLKGSLNTDKIMQILNNQTNDCSAEIAWILGFGPSSPAVYSTVILIIEITKGMMQEGATIEEIENTLHKFADTLPSSLANLARLIIYTSLPQIMWLIDILC